VSSEISGLIQVQISQTEFMGVYNKNISQYEIAKFASNQDLASLSSDGRLE
jgi:hypothetical protein